MGKIKCIIWLLLLVSCHSLKVTQQQMAGNFYYQTKEKDFSMLYSLQLKTDSTFSIKIGWQDCNGFWSITPKNEIFLQCEEPKFLEPLTRGYLSRRTYRLKVLNINEIQIDSVVLKRRFHQIEF